ncbi:hypothetical protein D0Z03_000071 [Geotrichum reessii]|nr:hypothetical protein D0Z03_000071 [Galactomyces reessii]
MFTKSKHQSSLLPLILATLIVLYSMFFFFKSFLLHNILESPVTSPASTVSKNSGLRSRPHAITYTPLTNAGTCKPLADIITDLNRIYAAHVPAVRLYSTDCNVLEAVIPTTNAARQTFRALNIDFTRTNSKLKLTVGLFPYLDNNEDGTSNFAGASRWFKSLEAQLADLRTWNQWHTIELLSVGSGGLFDESYTAAELVAMLRHVRAIYGHPEIPITTAEPVQSYVSHNKFNAASVENYHQSRAAGSKHSVDDDLCAAVDVIGITVHPYFNSAVRAFEAGKLVQRDIKFVDYLCSDSFIGAGRNGQFSTANVVDGKRLSSASTSGLKPNTKRIMVLEAGWPNAGADNGVAQPGVAAQQMALESILEHARLPDTGAPVDVAFYTFENEHWREPGELKVETNFGISHLL